MVAVERLGDPASCSMATPCQREALSLLVLPAHLDIHCAGLQTRVLGSRPAEVHTSRRAM